MLKRLYSKRSGFTLVEIIVAVAIFAIMAAAVAGIVQRSVDQRYDNLQYGRDLANQEDQLARVVKDGNNYDMTVTDTDKYGDYILDFVDSAGNPISATLAYQALGADGTETTEGINYFVSPVKYDGVAPTLTTSNSSNSNGTNGSSSGGWSSTNTSQVSSDSVAAIVDVRMTASAGMKNVKVLSVTKTGSPVSGAAVRYVIQTSADSTGMNDQDKASAQYKLYFYDENTLDTVNSSLVYSGKNPTTNSSGTYTKKMYAAANIVSAGYCDASGSAASHVDGKPTVKTTGSNCVTVSVARGFEGGSISSSNNYAGTGFNNEITTFYVDFAVDPDININSFGKNSSNGEYTKPTISVAEGNYKNTYVYGYYDFDLTWLS